MSACSFWLFSHRAVRFLLRKLFGRGELYTDSILLTSHIFNGTIKHKVQKRVKSLQDTTCYWRSHTKQWLETKTRYVATEDCTKDTFSSPALFPPSSKAIKQTRPEVLNSVLFIKVQIHEEPVCVVPRETYRLFKEFFETLFKILTFLFSANFRGILRILQHNKSIQVTPHKKTPKTTKPREIPFAKGYGKKMRQDCNIMKCFPQKTHLPSGLLEYNLFSTSTAFIGTHRRQTSTLS